MPTSLSLGLGLGQRPAVLDASFGEWVQQQSGYRAWFDVVSSPPEANGSGHFESWTSVDGNYVLEPDTGSAKSQIIVESDPDGDGFDNIRCDRGHSLHLSSGHPSIDIDVDGDSYNVVTIARANSANIDGFVSLYAAANATAVDGAVLRMTSFTSAAFQIYDDAGGNKGNRSVSPLSDMSVAGNWNLLVGRHFYDGSAHRLQVTGGGQDGDGSNSVTAGTFANFDKFLVGGFGAEDTTGACRIRAVGIFDWSGNAGDMFDEFEYGMGASGEAFAADLDDKLLALFNSTHTGLSANARA